MSDSIYRTVLDKSPICYALFSVVCDKESRPCDFKYYAFNSNYEQFAGINRQSLGKTVLELNHRFIIHNEFDLFGILYETALNKSNKMFEQLFKSRSRLYWIHIYCLENGYIMSTFFDITAQKQLELELRENYDFQKALMDVIPNPVFYKDMNGIYTGCNKAFERFLNKSADQILGKSVYDMAPQEIAGRYFEKDRLVFDGIENPQAYEWVVIDKDGNKKYVIFNKSLIVDDQGNKKGLVGVITDITEKKLAEMELAKEKELLQVTLVSVGDGIICTDQYGCITMLNTVAERLTGWTSAEARGKDIDEIFVIINEITMKKQQNPLQMVLQTGQVMTLANHTILISKDGGQIPIADSAAPIKDEEGNILGVVLVFRDVTDERSKRDEILYLSYHDSLTGLYNRRYFEEQLAKTDLKHNLPISIIIGDINGLKLTNDVFGHAEGDRLIIRIADILKNACRKEDIVARWGGDEFIMLLTNTTSAEAKKICGRIRSMTENERMDSVVLSISLGYETKERPDEPIRSIINKAEDFMYRRKLIESPLMRENTILTILDASFENNPIEKRHSETVGKICRAFGEELKLPQKQIERLELAGRIHDIGKIAIDKRILNKIEKLSKADWREIKRHPEAGYRILYASRNMGEIADYILKHHERLDGGGYPKGVNMDEIPLEARILAIAEAYETMSEERPYGNTLSKEESIQELSRYSGTHFDPQLVELFIKKILDKV